MAALVDRNDKFQISMVRAGYAQRLINETEANRDVAYVKHRKILQDSKFTVEQLKAILSDESKMLGMPVMDEPTAMDEPKASAADYTDLRELMCSNNDDQLGVGDFRGDAADRDGNWRGPEDNGGLC